MAPPRNTRVELTLLGTAHKDAITERTESKHHAVHGDVRQLAETNFTKQKRPFQVLPCSRFCISDAGCPSAPCTLQSTRLTMYSHTACLNFIFFLIFVQNFAFLSFFSFSPFSLRPFFSLWIDFTFAWLSCTMCYSYDAYRTAFVRYVY